MKFREISPYQQLEKVLELRDVNGSVALFRGLRSDSPQEEWIETGESISNPNSKAQLADEFQETYETLDD